MRTIVVGVDDSTDAIRALRWTLDEAFSTGARVIAVHAWRSPIAMASTLGGGIVEPAVVQEDVRGAAEEIVRRVVAACGADGDEVDARAVPGRATDVLIEVAAAEGTDLLVVGTRGHGAIAGFLRGSVSAYLAHHAPCPLVIVPAAVPAAAPDWLGKSA